MQLDCDETNVNHHLQQQRSIDSLSTKRPSSPPLNTSEPILSTGDYLRPDDRPVDAHHHRRAFSDDNALATVTQSIQTNQSHSNLKAKDDCLFSLSRSHSEESIGASTQLASAVLNGEGPSHIHHEDTVEVSLLADLSMDSRESQPLLGRDTQDYVYNNFPGKPHFNKIN